MIDDNMFQDRIAREPVPEPPPFTLTDQEQPEVFSFFGLFTYPLSRPGLTVMGFYVLVPFFLWVLAVLVSGVMPLLGLALGFILILARIVIVLSTFWYLTVCIRASAEGQTKAPDVFEYSQDDSFWDWLREFFLVLITVCLCVGPAFIVKYYTDASDVVFWSLLGAGIFFLPMCLLAIVMFDTINALNPILIVPSVFSTFFSYIVVVILFFVPIALVGGMVTFSVVPLLSVPVKAVSLYLLMMAACLLGRFFYNHEEKLCWDV